MTNIFEQNKTYIFIGIGVVVTIGVVYFIIHNHNKVLSEIDDLKHHIEDLEDSLQKYEHVSDKNNNFTAQAQAQIPTQTPNQFQAPLFQQPKFPTQNLNPVHQPQPQQHARKTSTGATPSRNKKFSSPPAPVQVKTNPPPNPVAMEKKHVVFQTQVEEIEDDVEDESEDDLDAEIETELKELEKLKSEPKTDLKVEEE